MGRKIKWENWTVRASQSSKLMVGNIGLTDKEKEERAGLLARKMANARGENDDKGKPVKPLTQNMENRLVELNEKEKDKTLPKTMTNELRKIHRMETYNRNFVFTNKYIQKGLSEEEEAITSYQMYLTKIGQRVLLTKNTERLFGDWCQGEPDIWRKGDKIGYDTKCSWDLSTFPYQEDDLDLIYEAQNQCYMELTGAEKWKTVYVLVNSSEQLVNNEKNKWMYALSTQKDGNPMDAPEHPFYQEYITKCKEVERMMIFDYNRFIDINPYHHMEHTKEEWFDGGYDIPLEERVIEKTSEYDQDFINELQERVLIAREYLKSLK